MYLLLFTYSIVKVIKSLGIFFRHFLRKYTVDARLSKDTDC